MVVGCLSTVRVCVYQQLLLGCVAIEISSSIVQNKAREFHEMREQTKQRRRQPSNLPFCFYFWFKGLQSFCFSFSVPVPLIGPPLDKSPHLYIARLAFPLFSATSFNYFLRLILSGRLPLS